MSAAASPSAAPALAQWQPRANPWLIATAVMAATFMEVLDTTVVNVSLPHIAGSLSSSIDESTWVLTSYLVANAIILPATGWLSTVFGRKRFLLACIVLFTLASALCGASATLGMLIVARVLQGAAGGALQPISQAVLLESFPPAKRGVAMAAFGMGVVVAPIIGPTLGGWMTDNYSWRWVFYINLPVGLIAVMMVHFFLEDPPYIRAARTGRIDVWGFLLLMIWVGSLQVVFDKGQQDDWLASTFIRTLVITGGIGLVLFIFREFMTDAPLVNLRILGNRNFTVGVALMTLMGAVLYGSIALLPLFLQTLMGYSAYQSGLTTSPRGFGSIVGMIIIGRIMGFLDSRMLIAIGFIIVAWSTWAFGNVNLEVNSAAIMWPNIYNGFGTALIFVPLTTMTMGTLKNEQMGNATGIFNLMRNLGGGIGIALVTTLLARGAQTNRSVLLNHVTPYDLAFQQQYSQVEGAVAPQVGAAQAPREAYAIINGQVDRQASLVTYVDDFRLLAIASLGCVPAVLLFKKATVKRKVSVH
ncbi:MAG TPA: DHA2 family efflux MFS transporter permease subunit [Phycisphaerae bacterium]|nr:DHA2 family efflux MFS transporter permease subunit [Phycisphaerae bacterium]